MERWNKRDDCLRTLTGEPHQQAAEERRTPLQVSPRIYPRGYQQSTSTPSKRNTHKLFTLSIEKSKKQKNGPIFRSANFLAVPVCAAQVHTKALCAQGRRELFSRVEATPARASVEQPLPRSEVPVEGHAIDVLRRFLVAHHLLRPLDHCNGVGEGAKGADETTRVDCPEKKRDTQTNGVRLHIRG